MCKGFLVKYFLQNFLDFSQMSIPAKITKAIPEQLFRWALSSFLPLFRWKRQIVQKNRAYVCNESVPDSTVFYKLMLTHLTRHVSEILFRFSQFKQAAQDTASYPCQVNRITFELAEGSTPVLEKMRHGGIFLTAHYGNYEAIGPWLCRLGIPLKASYIPLKPQWLNRLVEKKLRAVDGRSYSINAKNPREFLRLLDEGQLFCLLMDQDSRIASAIETNFLGKHAHTNPLPDFLLKHRPQTPVFICWMEETDGARHKVLHAIEVTASESIKGKSAPVADAFNRWLEERIAENPALWYGWTHRRFYSSNPKIYL